ncbi:hypothetical protein LTR17_027674 [Elasticomyces elasticus]|nr:hypothetical protein LTR17_027674 [Elasticomyces elasticus]
MSLDSPVGQQGTAPPASTPQLSCELCRERKVKCDKLQPCTTCVTADVECIAIFRPRLPRGRHAQKKTTAAGQPQQKSKQQRRESQQLQQALHSPTQTRAGTVNADSNGSSDVSDISSVRRTNDGQVESSGSSSMADVSYSGPSKSNSQSISSMDFSQPLSPLFNTEVNASSAMVSTHKDLASMTADEMFWINTFGKFNEPSSNTFTLPDDFGNTGTQSSDRLPQDFGTGPFTMLCAAKQDTAPVVPTNVNSLSTQRLFQVYLEQVDPVVKILHRPCLTGFMKHGEPYLDFPEGHSSVAALSAAVCYAAACTLSDTQCWALFREGKASVVSSTQAVCESALERAEVLVTSDITALQAFVLYLIGRRSKEQGRVVWTLVSLAVRLAKGIALHVDPFSLVRGSGESFFDRQMRKRLWLTICVMDVQASFAYGSEPLIHVEEVSGALDGLKHVNDADFKPTTTGDLVDKEELTDVTFPFVTFLAQVSGRLLHYESRRGDLDVVATRSRSNSNIMSARSGDAAAAVCIMDQEDRKRISSAFEQKAFPLLRFCDPEASHRAWFAWHGTQALVAATRLAAVRPSQHTTSRVDETKPTGYREEQRLNIELQLGMRILEKFVLMRSDSRSEALRWYLLVPWQALDVVVAGCRVCADEDTVRQAWPLVESVWQDQQSQDGPHDQKAIATQMETKIRQTRDMLRPLLGSGKRSGRTDSALGSTMSGFSTPLRAHATPMSYGPLSGLSSNATMFAPSNDHSQTMAQKSWSDSSMADAFGAPMALMGRSMPMQQVNEYPIQTWDDAGLSGVDDFLNGAEADMTGGYSSSDMMPL